MNYKNLITLFAVLLILSSCNKKDDTEENNQQSEEQQMQPQDRDMIHQPDQMQQDQQQNAPQSWQQQSQTEIKKVSDKELKQFASAVKQLEIINQEVQKNMTDALAKEKLTIERFKEIQQTQQNPDQQSNVSDEDLAKYKNAIQKLQQIQIQAQQDMLKQISDKGLTQKRYQEIATSIQNDVNLQTKIEEYFK
jgi:hypothetical protein